MNDRETDRIPELCRDNLETLVKVDSTTLFAGRREIIIRHNNEKYRLSITRQEKLILTK